MEFSTTIESLKFWLGRASTGLGRGAASRGLQGFIFREFDGFVEVVCTDTHSFACVRTTIPMEKDTKGFILSDALLNIITYADSEDISFKFLGSDVVEIVCGGYVGRWKQLVEKEFPPVPELVLDQSDFPNQKDVFIQSIERVMFASEGVLGGEERVVFKDGVCWGGSNRRFQEVVTGFDSSLHIIVPSVSLGVLRFLDASPSNNFKFAESDTHIFFFDGKDVFICKRAKVSKVDERATMEASLFPTKQVHFVKETDVLSRAIQRASATCEEKSAEIIFELFRDKLVIIGRDKYGNFGEDSIKISLQGKAGQFPIRRIAGWQWVLAALVAANDKAVTVSFDEHFAIVKSEKSKGIFALWSTHGRR